MTTPFLLRYWLILGSTLAAFVPKEAEARCQVPWFHFGKKGDIRSVTFYVEKDTGCNLRITSRPDGTVVIAKPKHGRFGQADTSEWAYIPAPGFVGEDDFAIRIYLVGGRDHTNTWDEVHYHVKVLPRLCEQAQVC